MIVLRGIEITHASPSWRDIWPFRPKGKVAHSWLRSRLCRAVLSQDPFISPGQFEEWVRGDERERTVLCKILPDGQYSYPMHAQDSGTAINVVFLLQRMDDGAWKANVAGKPVYVFLGTCSLNMPARLQIAG